MLASATSRSTDSMIPFTVDVLRQARSLGTALLPSTSVGTVAESTPYRSPVMAMKATTQYTEISAGIIASDTSMPTMLAPRLAMTFVFPSTNTSSVRDRHCTTADQ